MNINKSQIQHLIVDILQKKELADIDPLFVLFQINELTNRRNLQPGGGKCHLHTSLFVVLDIWYFA